MIAGCKMPVGVRSRVNMRQIAKAMVADEGVRLRTRMTAMMVDVRMCNLGSEHVGSPLKYIIVASCTLLSTWNTLFHIQL